jgi:hypothetical protein
MENAVFFNILAPMGKTKNIRGLVNKESEFKYSINTAIMTTGCQ